MPKKSKTKANSTQCSQAVSHPSTNRARHCLTSVIGRELVYSMWYGRCRMKEWNLPVRRFTPWKMCNAKGGNSIQCSQAVSHPSTNQARPCLASEIGRDRARSGWYGRKPESETEIPYLNVTVSTVDVHVWPHFLPAVSSSSDPSVFSTISLIKFKFNINT